MRYIKEQQNFYTIYFIQNFYLKSSNEYIRLKQWLFCFELKLICLFIHKLKVMQEEKRGA